MANRDWDKTQAGENVPSNARTTLRTTGRGNAASFIQGAKTADPGQHCDPLDSRGDLFGASGQLSTCN